MDIPISRVAFAAEKQEHKLLGSLITREFTFEWLLNNSWIMYVLWEITRMGKVVETSAKENSLLSLLPWLTINNQFDSFINHFVTLK